VATGRGLFMSYLKSISGGSGSATPSARRSDAPEFIPLLELCITGRPAPHQFGVLPVDGEVVPVVAQYLSRIMTRP